MGLTGFQRRRRRAARRRREKEKQKENENTENMINELTVDEGTALIKETDDLEKLNSWLKAEKEDKARVTLIEPLEEKIKEIETDNSKEDEK